jgi:addiction module HigA family antidote
MSAKPSELARKLKTQPRTINEICRGKRSISPRMAFLLADAFDTTPEVWMNLQSSWDLWQEWEKMQKRKKAS